MPKKATTEAPATENVPLDWREKPLDERYFNRELSWLKFNMRVLEEANNVNHPLLERVNFLSISGSNLDEFYMVRVAGLKSQKIADVERFSTDGRTAGQQLKLINKLAEKLLRRQQKCWRKLTKELAREEIFVLKNEDITEEEHSWLADFFLREVFQILTPLTIDPAHPMPFIPNLGFCLMLSLERISDNNNVRAIIPIPPQISRFVRIGLGGRRFIALEDLVFLFMDELFPGYKILGKGVFRVVRDSDLEIDDEAQDLVVGFESALKRRRRGHVIRLKIAAGMPDDLRRQVVNELEADDESVVEVDGILGICDVKQIIVRGRPDLKFKPYNARYPERIRDFGGDIFAAIRAKDFVVHHPYESFDVVHKFISQAAKDPQVVAIKQTLYRAGPESPIVKALIEAGEAGKSVTAVVELKARFDEEQNIKLARDMERASVHVVYGFMELKTHAKVSMVVRREEAGLQTYCHLGTGNYHPVNAKIYTDLSYFTSDPALGRDVGKLFNYLTSYVPPRELEKLYLSPHNHYEKIMSLIDNEIENAKAGKPAHIWAKMNSLVGAGIIDKLYDASCAGVKIDLVVRGICCLKPGIPGMSENITVKSIVGRFLEHARIYAFGNGHELPSDEAAVFISSSDWMPRNFFHRVEALVPIENPTVKQQVLGQILAANMKDNAQSWVMNSKGKYARLEPGDSLFDAHEYFMTNPSLSGRGTALQDTDSIRQLYPAKDKS